MKRDLINCAVPTRMMNSVSSDDFKVYAKADEQSVELMIFDGIGKDEWTGTGIGARDVASFLADNRGKPVNVRLNSPGGLAWDGISIHNALIQHDAKVTTTVEGLAASAASIIMVASDWTRMFENSQAMVHRAWGLAMGNANEFQDVADLLQKLDGSIASTYAAKTGRKVETMLKFMDGKVDGTYFTAAEALKEGFADEVIPLPKGINRAKNEIDPQERVKAALERERHIKNMNAAARARLLEVGR